MNKLLILSTEDIDDEYGTIQPQIAIQEIDGNSDEFWNMVIEAICKNSGNRATAALSPENVINMQGSWSLKGLKNLLSQAVARIEEYELKQNKEYQKQLKISEEKERKIKEERAAKALARKIKNAEELLRKEGVLKELARNDS